MSRRCWRLVILERRCMSRRRRLPNVFLLTSELGVCFCRDTAMLTVLGTVRDTITRMLVVRRVATVLRTAYCAIV
eukprot:2872943-Pyramimonas_sp.AAC.1